MFGDLAPIRAGAPSEPFVVGAVQLPGLSENQVAELVTALGAGPLTRHATRRLWEHTGGNPLWVRALVAELSAEQLAAADLGLPAPIAFARGVRGRLARCSAAARALVAAASVGAGTTSLGALGRLAELDEPFHALDEATSLDLLSTSGSAPATRVMFPHPLIRAAAYDALDAAHRSSLHLRAARLAEDEAGLLRHLVAASPGSDEELAERVATHARMLRDTGEMAIAGAGFRTAARLTPRVEDRDMLLLEAAQTYLMGGGVEEAVELLGAVSERAPSPQRDLVDGWIAQSMGHLERAAELLERAWCMARPDDWMLRSKAGRLLASLSLLGGHGLDCAAWGERIQASASIDWERHYASGVVAMGLAIAGRSEDALRALAWLPDRGELGPTHLDAAACRGNIMVWTDRLDEARAEFVRVLSGAPRYGSFQMQVSVLASLVEVEHRAGNWDDAVAHGDRAVEFAETSDQGWGIGPTHALVSHARARRGQWAAARRHVDEATSQARVLPGNASVTAYAADAAVLLAHSKADWAGLLVAADPLLNMAGLDGAYEPGVFTWRELYCEALIRLRMPDEASAALAPYEQLAAKRGRRSAIGAAARVRAMLHADTGDLPAADDAFQAAVDHADAVGIPFDRALAQLAHGGALRRAGRRRAAVERLTAAAATFVQLRAEPFIAQAEQELRGCGQARRHRADAGRPELTSQEHSVALLVASGLSNREAAAHLVVSVKTVEFHLTRIFAKLGVRSRSQLTRRMIETGSAAVKHGTG